MMVNSDGKRQFFQLNRCYFNVFKGSVNNDNLCRFHFLPEFCQPYVFEKHAVFSPTTFDVYSLISNNSISLKRETITSQPDFIVMQSFCTTFRPIHPLNCAFLSERTDIMWTLNLPALSNINTALEQKVSSPTVDIVFPCFTSPIIKSLIARWCRQLPSR